MDEFIFENNRFQEIIDNNILEEVIYHCKNTKINNIPIHKITSYSIKIPIKNDNIDLVIFLRKHTIIEEDLKECFLLASKYESINVWKYIYKILTRLSRLDSMEVVDSDYLDLFFESGAFNAIHAFYKNHNDLIDIIAEKYPSMVTIMMATSAGNLEFIKNNIHKINLSTLPGVYDKDIFITGIKMQSTYSGNIDVLKLIDGIFPSEEKLLILATKSRKLEIVKYTIYNHRTNIKSINESIILSSANGDLEIVRYLCQMYTIGKNIINKIVNNSIDYDYVFIYDYLVKEMNYEIKEKDMDKAIIKGSEHILQYIYEYNPLYEYNGFKRCLNTANISIDNAYILNKALTYATRDEIKQIFRKSIKYDLSKIIYVYDFMDECEDIDIIFNLSEIITDNNNMTIGKITWLINHDLIYDDKAMDINNILGIDIHILHYIINHYGRDTFIDSYKDYIYYVSENELNDCEKALYFLHIYKENHSINIDSIRHDRLKKLLSHILE